VQSLLNQLEIVHAMIDSIYLDLSNEKRFNINFEVFKSAFEEVESDY